MNRVDANLFRQCHDAWDVEVRTDRLAGLADSIGFVRLESMQCVAVLVRVDRNRSNSQLSRTSKDSNSDFRTIGNKQLFEGWHGEFG